MISKQEWIKQLKVGDRVCNCNFEHLTIKKIADDRAVWRPWLYRWFITAEWVPARMTVWIDTVWSKVGRSLGLMILVDRTLILEDGSQCSAEHCCDPVEHEWNHILRGKNNE